MKRHLSALAVLFYILTVPMAQAGPTSWRLPLCEINGCTKDEETGKWESDISEDCEIHCRRSCISLEKGSLFTAFAELSGDGKKGGGCETSANSEPLAKEAMPTSSPEITATTEACPEAGCRCEALYGEACQNNRFCYFNVQTTYCETLIGHGVEEEEEFNVPLSQPPYITQGGKPLKPGKNYSWYTNLEVLHGSRRYTTTIRLKGSAAAKVKEPGGYIEWIPVKRGGCFFNQDELWYQFGAEYGNDCGNRQETACKASTAYYCSWDDVGKTCYSKGERKPKRWCGNSMTQAHCENIGKRNNRDKSYCVWLDDASSYQFTEERLNLCRVDSDGDDECGSAHLDGLVSGSFNNKYRHDSLGVLSLKNGSNFKYFELGLEGRSDAAFVPTWVKIKVGDAKITRVVVKVKDAQTRVMCDVGGGYYHPDTRAACSTYGTYTMVPNESSTEERALGESFVPEIQGILLTGDEYSSLQDVEGFSYYFAFNSRKPGRSSSARQWLARKGLNNKLGYATAPIAVEGRANCKDKPQECDAITLDFMKIWDCEQENWTGPDCSEVDDPRLVSREDEYFIEEDAERYVLLWFPHGYLHLWSVDIYHYSKSYDHDTVSVSWPVTALDAAVAKGRSGKLGDFIWFRDKLEK